VSKRVRQNLTAQVDGIQDTFTLDGMEVFVFDTVSVTVSGVDQPPDAGIWEEQPNGIQIKFLDEVPQPPDTLVVSFNSSASGDPGGDDFYVEFC